MSKIKKLMAGIFLLFSIFIFSSCSSNRFGNPTIFDDFSELSFLDEYIIENNEIGDDLDKITTEGLNIKLEYNGVKYDIQTYQFITPEECRKFVSKQTGNTIESIFDNTHVYHKSGSSYLFKNYFGFKEGKYIVHEDNKCYFVKSKTNKKNFNND